MNECSVAAHSGQDIHLTDASCRFSNQDREASSAAHRQLRQQIMCELAQIGNCWRNLLPHKQRIKPWTAGSICVRHCPDLDNSQNAQNRQLPAPLILTAAWVAAFLLRHISSKALFVRQRVIHTESKHCGPEWKRG